MAKIATLQELSLQFSFLELHMLGFHFKFELIPFLTCIDLFFLPQEHVLVHSGRTQQQPETITFLLRACWL
jgi:hypothetical protein